MTTFNAIFATDSYKWTHHGFYPEGTDHVYSYFEAREGAEYPETVFFGLQSILVNQLAGIVVTEEMIEEAKFVSEVHFGRPGVFNEEGWRYILERHHGRLPLEIRAVPEGTPVPVGNVLMTVVNTDPHCAWLTNAVESLLVHCWYPSTVATKSRETKKLIKRYLDETADTDAGLPFMLHDFGYRGATTHEAAALGGAAHLVNFVGTDTLPALKLAAFDYYAQYERLGFSVPATEHSVMTALGADGELDIVDALLDQHPTGILSVVADSYNIYNFVDALGSPRFHGRILSRDGVFVVRPDSVTDAHSTPESLVVYLLAQLGSIFGQEKNGKGYRVLNEKVRLIWGDGIDYDGINAILAEMTYYGWSAENIVFGMGGGLLQKLNRDTQRFAFKCAAQHRGGEWRDVQKNPLDSSKKSKAGLLKLVYVDGEYKTVRQNDPAFDDLPDLLELVFRDGDVLYTHDFESIRDRAAL